MEFLDRGSLTEVLDQFHKEPLNEAEMAYVCREVCYLSCKNSVVWCGEVW